MPQQRAGSRKRKAPAASAAVKKEEEADAGDLAKPRDRHNLLERQRRVRMADSMEALAKAIPDLSWQSFPTKKRIVDAAAAYIARLRRELEQAQRLLADDLGPAAAAAAAHSPGTPSPPAASPTASQLSGGAAAGPGLRRQADRAVQRVAARLAAAPGVLVFLRDRAGRVLFANAEAAEAAGGPLRDLIAGGLPEQLRRWDAVEAAVLRDGRPATTPRELVAFPNVAFPNVQETFPTFPVDVEVIASRFPLQIGGRDVVLTVMTPQADLGSAAPADLVKVAHNQCAPAAILLLPVPGSTASATDPVRHRRAGSSRSRWRSGRPRPRRCGGCRRTRSPATRRMRRGSWWRRSCAGLQRSARRSTTRRGCSGTSTRAAGSSGCSGPRRRR